MMHAYDAKQQFIDGLERYVSGIETDEGWCVSHGTCPPTMSGCPTRLAVLCGRSSGPLDASRRVAPERLRCCSSACGQLDPPAARAPARRSECAVEAADRSNRALVDASA